MRFSCNLQWKEINLCLIRAAHDPAKNNFILKCAEAVNVKQIPNKAVIDVNWKRFLNKMDQSHNGAFQSANRIDQIDSIEQRGANDQLVALSFKQI